MLIENPYLLLTFATAVALTLLGGILLGIRIPQEPRTVKLRVARLVLALSYFVLAAPNFLECLLRTNADTQVTAIFTLATAAFQSLLFTATMLTFILPGYVTRRRTLRQLGSVVVGVTIFLTTAFTCRNPYPVLAAGLVVYIGQITYYTLLFRRKYAESLTRLEEYYDEDVHARLRWVKCGFYAALSIGIAAAISVYLPVSLYNLFTIGYILFYAWFALRFFNYAAKIYYHLPAVVHAEQKPEAPATTACTDFTSAENQQRLAALQRAIDQWIADRGYAKSDEGIDQIAAELGTDIDILRYYFRTRLSSDFRSWRIGLRIEYAKELLGTDPGISMNALALKIGFSTRSNFYGYFKKATGETPLEFQKRVALGD